MFARGKGFLATVKVQWTFRLGAIVDFAAVGAAGIATLGWEIPLLLLICAAVCHRVYRRTVDPLFSNVSIVKYWRRDLGGKPDEDDPYDLTVPMNRFRGRSAVAQQFPYVLKAKAPDWQAEEQTAVAKAKEKEGEDRKVDVEEMGSLWTKLLQSRLAAGGGHPGSPRRPSGGTLQEGVRAGVV